ncbi:MAG: nitroreductase/quinone reductase family protein [Acidimicrobiales bacterium]
MNNANTPEGERVSSVRAHTLTLQRPVNRIVRGLLRAPLLCRLVGKRLLVVYLVGRKTGRHYAVPVAYTRANGNLLVGSPFSWIRNLRTGERVVIRLQGRQRPADVQVLTEQTEVIEHLALMARENHQFAKFNKIGFDERRAQARRLTPRLGRWCASCNTDAALITLV